ncbi:MAG: undecaprenyl/decaprenyl-phosphate alpha-N-acetylglucosaminyl 1-phosphate transferase [Chloroflexi bacterium]|nr:undecaprenyl/decaprenyl-phosphate alpha-N-acetylglucosaminyl 1-phosphate transferase [Chloroflexota bacterium]
MKAPDGGLLVILVAVFAAAALLSLVLTPVVRRLARRFDLVDQPGARRVHSSPIPRGGGLAVAAAFIAVAGVSLAVAPVGDLFDTSTLSSRQVVALLGGGALGAVLGTIDDWFDLRARWQLAGQVALAAFAVSLGITVEALANPFGPGTIELGGLFGVAFTVVWILGMINSINFIDGLDGLSSGIALIAAVTLAIISLTGPVVQPEIAVLCVALAGALAGFLRWNFHPASIFVGTSGVMFVGYTLALLSILGTAKVAVALLVLGVPIIDTFWIIVRRLAAGRSPFSPDRGHIHHRLLDLGLSHVQTVLLIYGLCAALGILSLVLSGSGQLYAFLGALVVFGLVLLLLERSADKGEEAGEARSVETGAAPGDEAGTP